MPVTITDKKGKDHTFNTHAAAVKWIKKNRPNVKDPDAFVADIERRQTASKFSEPLAIETELGEISVSNIIRGVITFDKKNVKVKNVEIFLEGIKEVIAEVPAVDQEFGASFSHIIDARARAGEYRVAWNLLVDNVETQMFKQFIISSDSIDRTLPVELQHLR